MVLPVATLACFLAAPPPADSALLLSAGPGSTLSPFAPGKTATGSGSVTVTDDNPSWTLQAEDQGTGGGRMVAAAAGCTGSDAILADPLQVSVTSPLTGITSAGPISLSSSNQTVVSSSNPTLTAAALSTNYAQVIPLSEAMLTGCVYQITVTYTLQ